MSHASTRVTPRLVVVDDDEDMAILIAKAARFIGYEALVASPKELLDLDLENEVDVVVLDLFMPNTDGYQLIESLSEQGSSAAIILISGYDETFLKTAEIIAKAKGLDLRKRLTKPLVIDEFQSLIRKIKVDRGFDNSSEFISS